MLTRTGWYLIAGALVVFVSIVLSRFPAHLADTLWPAHAKAHLVSQIASLTGLVAVGLALLSSPFRTRQKWAWYGLLACGLFAFGGYWLGGMVAEPGVPWRTAHTIFGLLSACYFLGLAFAWRHFFVPAP